MNCKLKVNGTYTGRNSYRRGSAFSAPGFAVGPYVAGKRYRTGAEVRPS